MASTCPVVSSEGGTTEKRRIGIGAPTPRSSPMTSSVSASALAMAERSTRCGASGHIPEKASVRQVSAAEAARSAFT